MENRKLYNISDEDMQFYLSKHTASDRVSLKAGAFKELKGMWKTGEYCKIAKERLNGKR